MAAASNMYLLALLGGTFSHLFVFRVGEWDLLAPSIFVCHLLILAVATRVSSTHFDVPFNEVVTRFLYYLAGLYTSMLLYRAFFHRLSKYPGPFLARLTNFYITAKSTKKLHLFKEVEILHAKYGDYVRIGPSEISIADPSAVQAIYGTHSPTTKGPFYTLIEPRVPLFSARDKREHAQRRKVWDQGFTTKALLGYDTRITKAIDQLLCVIDRDHKQPIDIAKWIGFFAFDVMEDLVFNKNSNMLLDGEENYVFKTIRSNMYDLAYFAHHPWALTFVKRIPILNADYLTFWKWIKTQIDQRVQNAPDQPDIFSWILDEFNRGVKTKQDRLNLDGDAQLIVVAGTDSVVSTLSHLFFELAWDAELVKRLQEEFDKLPNLENGNLMNVEFLDAVINETLRLHPAVPSGTQRVTPPEGLQIGDERIPGNTIVQVPQHTIFRDPRAFELPNDFIPERWTTRQELIKNKASYIPFSIGPYGCVGKRLAMMEMRRFVAEIVSRYDIVIAPGQSREGFLDEKQDTFTVVPASLPVVFTPRAS